jgi:methyl-accepting chemotaxis protein
MLGTLRISSKLLIMICLSVLGVVAVAGVGLAALKSNLLEDRKAKLADMVLLARQAVDLEYQAAKRAGLSDSETLSKCKVILRSLRYGKDDFFFALDKDGVMIAHPIVKIENTNLLDAKNSDGVYYVRMGLELAKNGGGFNYYRASRSNTGEPVPKIGYSLEYKPLGLFIGSGVYIDDVDTIFREQMLKIGALVGLTLLLVVGMGLLLRRSIVKPLTAMTGAMRKLADGDTNTDIPALGRRDEVGAIALSVEIFKSSMIETARLRTEQDELKDSAEREKVGLLNAMADDFEKSVRASLDLLTGSSDEMRQTAQSMSTTAGQARQQTVTVASGAEQATANVQMVAAATEELSSSVSEIGRQVTQSTEIAAKAVAEANHTNRTVQGLSEAAQKIGDVVKLITAIASQTNLLALNATIEAARAGDAGKGFAVVANEVKSLANQTASATEEISAQVAAMQGATSQAVQAIESIGATIGTINEITTTIASAVEQQGAATREISRNVQQAAEGTYQVSNDIAGVSRTTSEAGETANSVRASAEQLSEQSATLRTGINQFLANIRAA